MNNPEQLRFESDCTIECENDTIGISVKNVITMPINLPREKWQYTPPKSEQKRFRIRPEEDDPFL